MTKPTAWRARSVGAALVLLLAACAKVAPPPGGPEDRDPPAVVTDAVRPARGAAAIAPDSVLMIVFTERTDERSVLRALTVFPRVDFKETSWHEDTLLLRPDPHWPPQRNVVLRIGPGARDRRGNEIATPFSWSFTTKAVADTGRIVGRLWPGREKTAGARLLAFAITADTVANGAEPWSLADVEASGEFTLDGLDTNVPWQVAGLIDRDGDARPGGVNEAFSLAPEIVRFGADSALARGSDFLVGTLDSIATIRGEVTADSGAVIRVDVVDAAGAPAFSDSLVGGGVFSVEVPSGRIYRVTAFVDLDGDGAIDEDETRAALEEDVRMDLASERSGIAFDLATRTPPAAPSPEGPPPIADPPESEAASP